MEKVDWPGWHEGWEKAACRLPRAQWHQGSLTAAIPDDQVPAFLQVYGEEVGKGAGQVTQAITGFPESLHRWRRSEVNCLGKRWSLLKTNLQGSSPNSHPCRWHGYMVLLAHSCPPPQWDSTRIHEMIFTISTLKGDEDKLPADIWNPFRLAHVLLLPHSSL